MRGEGSGGGRRDPRLWGGTSSPRGSSPFPPRPVQDIVADIHHGTGVPYGPEKLLELFKMLPDGKEVIGGLRGGADQSGSCPFARFMIAVSPGKVEKLESFQGDRSRLSEAEVFALLLVQVPR